MESPRQSWLSAHRWHACVPLIDRPESEMHTELLEAEHLDEDQPQLSGVCLTRLPTGDLPHASRPGLAGLLLSTPSPLRLRALQAEN
jgi:hypothetical protein